MRQLKVDKGQGSSNPVGVDIIDHLPGSDCPVVLSVGGTPLLSPMKAEDNVILRLIARVYHCFGHGKHQADGAVVILEAPKVGVVVATYKDLMF